MEVDAYMDSLQIEKATVGGKGGRARESCR